MDRRVAHRVNRILRGVLLVGAGLSCGGPAPAPVVLPKGSPTPDTFFLSQRTDSRFYTAEHLLASIEMQISGEPFAQLLGKNLAGYNRYSKTPDLYIDVVTGHKIVDPLSYSMAIESYEYSKQPMNNTSFESGAGLSLQYGPVLNPNQVTGDAAVTLLRDRLQGFAIASSAGDNWVVTPAPTDNPLNVYGWPGYWPVFAEFRSFKPDIQPAGGATHRCKFVFGYAALLLSSPVGDYECGYNSLNLPDRDAQVEKVLEPAALGFATWKQALWTINYWQTLHDLGGNQITQIDDADLANVGRPENIVVGQFPDPFDPTGKHLLRGVGGVYLGDIPLEGWQGLTMLDEMDNKAAFTLTRIMTSDGARLGGFASTKEAMAYDYQSPLRWWPAAIVVTEAGSAPPVGQSWKYFPRPTTFTIQTPASRLRGLVAIAGGQAELFALTDFNNASVGSLPSSRATFDGDPFPADNQLPDGEESPHDRSLANIKVAVVDMDRMHFDPAQRVLVDEANVVEGVVKRGGTVTTVDAAYAIVGLRTALRSISGTLSLYSNDTPDTGGKSTALDGAPLQGGTAPLARRMAELIRVEADFLVSRLIAADGSVFNSYDLAAGKADASPTRLEAEAGAIRGLLDAYLATSDARYQQAAMRVYADLDRRFWMSEGRAFRTTAGVDGAFTWSPLVFGAMQGALRQYWKIVGNRPGNERLGAEILERIQRLNKLIGNGWDDANGDNKVQFPAECTGAGLQMAERALTGELSHTVDGADRDHDCVQEISAAGMPAALASQVVFKRR